jgi:fatty acid desaturase
MVVGRAHAGVSERPATDALVAALDDWRRNGLALAAAIVAFAAAVAVGSAPAYFGAALVVFCVWMAWFVLTVIDWIGHADF